MRFPSFEKWLELDDREEEYYREKRKSFEDFVKTQVEAYIDSIEDTKWSAEDFAENMEIDWSFPDYEEWLWNHYESDKADYEEYQYESWRDRQMFG